MDEKIIIDVVLSSSLTLLQFYKSLFFEVVWVFWAGTVQFTFIWAIKRYYKNKSDIRLDG